MTKEKLCLASDNFSAAHPAIVQAIVDANLGYAPAYGGDPWTLKAQDLITKALKKQGTVYFLPTGTGSNVLALKLACRSHESVICTDIAHINFQESGAPEAIVGCKLLTVPHVNGKLTPMLVAKRLASARAFGKHGTSPRIISIAQPTEFGTVYTVDELCALSALCQQENLLLHIDGSRLYNAAVSLGIELHEMVADVAVDLISLGGTKNGMVGAEALLIINNTLVDGCDYLHKQTLQLLSKMRYLSAQYIPFFEDKLWQTLAGNANHRAQEIATIITNTPECSLSFPVESNQIFFTVPEHLVARIQEEIVCLLWDQETSQLRFIASWNTSRDDVGKLRAIFAKLAL